MTKHIHIINGDSSNHKVKVLIQDLQGEEWVTVQEEFLDNPGQISTRVIWKGRRLVIEERQ